MTGEHVPTAYVAPDVLIKYIASGDNHLDLLMDRAEKGEIILILSSFTLYETVAALNSDELNQERMLKALMAMEMIPSPKIPVTQERKAELRWRAGLNV